MVTPNSDNTCENDNFIYLNIQGIRSKVKIKYLSELLNINKCAFGTFTESHLNPDILDAEIEIENYKVIRADRIERLCGGSCIYIRNDIMCYDEFSWSNTVVSMCAVKLKTNDTLIINMYRPPDADKHENAFEEALIKLEELLAKNETNNIILTGDYNFPSIEWSQDDEMNMIITSKSIPKQATALLNILNEFSLVQCISKPTRGRNILDLVFTNNQQLINEVKITDTIHSDHRMIQCISTRLTKSQEKSCNHYEKFDTLNFNSQKIEWAKIESELESIDWVTLTNDKTVTEIYEIMTEQTLQIAEKYVPRRKTTVKTKFTRERRNIWSKLKRANDNITNNKRVIHNKNLVQSLEMQLIQSYVNENEEREYDAISKIKEDPKYFYKYANKHMKTKSTIGPLRNQSNKLTDNDHEMSNILKDQFRSVFSKPKFKFDTSKFYTTENPPFIVDVDEDNIISAINEMPNNTSSGPDTWPAILLKKCKAPLAKPLKIMWKLSLKTGEIPKELLNAYITPIYKKGDKCSAANYRPISLTSLIIKIIERIIRKHIIKYLEERRKLNNIQHAFRAGRSCLSQLLNHFDKILNTIELGYQYDVIYTDFAKAFDKCDFAIICEKLNKIGINDDVGRWIHNFLTQRTFSVVVNKTKSAEAVVESSVPQGTVLAPLLFLILINDIDKNIEDCDISTFADDTKIAKVIRELQNRVGLQEGINQLCEWTIDNNMMFNEDKFQMISYSQNPLHTPIEHTYHTKDGVEIKEEEEIRDLGVLMNKDMTFSSQVQKAVNKARQKSGWILRTFKSRDTNTIMTLYKSLVLPHVEYCSVLVSPHQITEIQLLESVQRSMTAKIVAYKDYNYYERLQILKLYSLQRRRERYTVIYTWKIIEGLCPNLPKNPIETYEHIRKGRLCKIPPINTRCPQRIRTIKDNTLPVRGPRLYNSLPKDLRDKSGVRVESFKLALDKYLSTVEDEPPTTGYYTRENSIIHRRPTGPSRA